MGEYATFKGNRIKIGSCESMYYLRADQRFEVNAESGSVDPVQDVKDIRFRFQWPEEDGVQPGAFVNYAKNLVVHGVEVPTSMQHSEVQFVAKAGYVTYLPCPESKEGKELPFKLYRNGFIGSVKITQQRVCGRLLVLVCECGGCGSHWSLETIEDVKPILNALEAMAIEEESYLNGDEIQAAYYRKIKNRIEKGYE